MSIIYCLFSNSLRERINSFYRRCPRLIYHLFECPTVDLHTKFLLPTLEEKFRKSPVKWLYNIERHAQELIACYVMNKTIVNKILQFSGQGSSNQSTQTEDNIVSSHSP